MGLHKFNANNEQKKLWFNKNKEKLIKIGTITMSIVVVVLGVIYFTMAKYRTSLDLDLIQTKVGNFSSNDVQIAAYVNGEKVNELPNDMSSYVLSKVLCLDTNNNPVSVTYDRTTFKIKDLGISSKTKCNMYFQTGYKETGVSYPELYEGLIPVYYENGNTMYANPTDTWYSYANHNWANAVIVDESIRSNYINDDGTFKTLTSNKQIPDDKILQYYVWIPRYKYQLWNVNNESSDEQMINVNFQTTDEAIEQGSSNGTWLTHPAFTFGNTILPGFWVGKFEPSNTTDDIRILPNVASLGNQTLGVFFNATRGIETTQAFGLNQSEVDTHVMKNMEWGAVAYLSSSQYGLYVNESTCSNSDNNITVTLSDSTTANRCQIWINPNESYTTGCTGATMDDASLTTCNQWNSSNNNGKSSTTGNIYGIYDMSGGAWEYVMGNVATSTSTYTYKIGNSGLDDPGTKYYDTYTNVQNSYHVDSHSNGRLGDATKETLKKYGNSSGGWFSDYAYFPSDANVWFQRGGHYSNGAYSGVFRFHHRTGEAKSNSSFRVVLSHE